MFDTPSTVHTPTSSRSLRSVSSVTFAPSGSELIVDTVQEQDIRLVGLSALMTTTVVSMEETIRQLREKAPGCLVMVGGAVLNQDYADMIGADFYGKDAMQSVHYAQKLFEGGN